MTCLPCSGPNDDGYFEINVLGDNLQCKELRTEEEFLIATEDIVCMLPNSDQREGCYRILFLRRSIEGANSDSEKETLHLASIWTASPPSRLLSQYLCTEVPSHLRAHPGETVNVHVIISSLSGTGIAKSIFHNILQHFLFYLQLVNYEVHETTSDRTIAELARSEFLGHARIGIPQTIILLSGDGGLTDIVDIFYNSSDETLLVPPSIALIPTGTGNAMANSIGLLSSPASGLRTLLQGRPQRLPVFFARFTAGAQYVTEEGRSRAAIGGSSITSKSPEHPKIFGTVVASWGMHAALVADSDTAEYRRYGADRFKMVAKELLYPSSGAETHRYKGVISLFIANSEPSKERVETMKDKEHMYVLATSVSKLEKDFVISPASRPLDGRLRLVYFGPMSPDEAMQLMNLAYQGGRHVQEKRLMYKEIEGLKIDFLETDERWRRVCIDGKIVTVEEGGWMEVRREPRHLLNLIACMP